MSGLTVGDESFDAYYFEHCCGRPYRRDEHWLAFFGAIADRIVSDIQPKHVLDAGCAMGFLVEALRDRGVNAEGIDISSYAIANVSEPIKPFCRRASVADELSDEYDLIVSIEVLEHMPARDAEAAIATFCRHTDDVLFSSTPSDLREPSHVNVNPPDYWAERFARHGFYRDIEFDASFITPWAVRFRRSREPLHRIVRAYERRFWTLQVERNEARSYSAEVQRDLAAVPNRISAADTERDEARAALAAEQARAAQLADEARAALAAVTSERDAVRAALEETYAHLTRKILALTAAEEELARVPGIESALAETRHSLAETQQALSHARDRLTATQGELALARTTIRKMEGSLFWRVRRIWAAISRLFGRPT